MSIANFIRPESRATLVLLCWMVTTTSLIAGKRSMAGKTGVNDWVLMSMVLVTFIIEIVRLRGVFLKWVLKAELNTASCTNNCGTFEDLLTFSSSVGLRTSDFEPSRNAAPLRLSDTKSGSMSGGDTKDELTLISNSEKSGWKFLLNPSTLLLMIFLTCVWMAGSP